MERRDRGRWAELGRGVVVGLGLLAGVSGCRSGRMEVPPEQPYLPPAPALGAQERAVDGPRVGFSTEPPTGGSPYGVAAAASNPIPPGMSPTRVAGSNEAIPAYSGQPAYGMVPGTAAYNNAALPPGDPSAMTTAAPALVPTPAPAPVPVPEPDPLQSLPGIGPGAAAAPTP